MAVRSSENTLSGYVRAPPSAHLHRKLRCALLLAGGLDSRGAGGRLGLLGVGLDGLRGERGEIGSAVPRMLFNLQVGERKSGENFLERNARRGVGNEDACDEVAQLGAEEATWGTARGTTGDTRSRRSGCVGRAWRARARRRAGTPPPSRSCPSATGFAPTAPRRSSKCR